jgi:hypothetical protein
VRRLLQFGMVLLLLALFMPLQEVFDRWDAPGLSNDTEFTFFALVLTICLVLVVCKLIALVALELGLVSVGILPRADAPMHSEAGHSVIFLGPPLSLVPLRI